MGEILLAVLLGDLGRRTDNPGASRVPVSGPPLSWDRHADVMELLHGNRGAGLHPCPGGETVVRRWMTWHELLIIREMDLRAAEEELAYVQRQIDLLKGRKTRTKTPSGLGRLMGQQIEARRALKAVNARIRATETIIDDLTHSTAYLAGMQYLARRMSERGLK